jgi:glycosyltransferase involved in cell wall biosynthesis
LIAVIVPAHNEEDQIYDCLASLNAAKRNPLLQSEQTIVIVVLDSCTENTRNIAQHMGAITIALDARNVGAARALGAQLALAAGARWLSFTDADTQVAPDWIAAQLMLKRDAVCGTVAVRDWGSYGDTMRSHYDATYTDADGHQHIHGANFGVSAQAYQKAGGFKPLASSEDVALVQSLQNVGASIAWSATPRVYTSARRTFRAPDGFGATLARVEQQQLQHHYAEALV